MKGKKILAIALVAVLIASLALVYVAYSEKAVAGQKNITIEVVMPDETSSVYEVSTDAEYLLGAMEEADGLTFEGEDGAYGFSINVINGVAADLNSGTAYWGFFVNDEYCNYGVSQQPIEDGDNFSIVYTVIE
jgi:hypothetical protein